MPHRATWTAWPAAANEWQDNLKPAQSQFIAMVRQIATSELVKVLVTNSQARALAENQLQGPNIEFVDIPYGDIWMRDTAPIFLRSKQNQTLALASFAFNGWGGKYILPFDDEVGTAVSRVTDLPTCRVPMVFEGGSIDVNGAGTALTTTQCLLNKNRNPNLDEAEIQNLVQAALGIRKLLWVKDGLLNDHTDGHIDNIARFVDAKTVLCMKPSGSDDPNRKTLDKIFSDLCKMTDAEGEPLTVIQVPSPGLLTDKYGKVIPASYMNFYIANKTVVVPTYGTNFDDEAVEQIGKYFPNRHTVGLRANAILTGGGSFHCITQQEPL